MAAKGRHWTGLVIDDLDMEPPGGWDDPDLHAKVQRAYNELMFKKSKETEMRKINMYEIFAVYAENPESPIVFRPKETYSFGVDEDEAVLRSGIHVVIAAARKEPTTEHLDLRYVTIIVRHVGAAKTP